MMFNNGVLVSYEELEDEESHRNSTKFNLEDLKMDSNFAWLLCSLLSGMFWVTYITYYHSRVLGYILTRILNRNFIVKQGYIHVGSFTWSVLSGKIMFRDVVYITNDFTLRVQDGWIIFRWWRSYVPKSLSEDLSHSDTRLSIMLNGSELHMYNRTKLYANLEKLFGLEPHIIAEGDEDAAETCDETPSTHISSSTWRDLIPVIKVDILSGRIVFGNRLVPTTLSVNVEEAHCMYSTKSAASRLDYYMHIFKCVAENFKVILAPSPKYTGMNDDPPRYMGEGFVVLSSNKVDLYYYMDQPGIVPEKPEMLQLANGDIVESAPPIWGIDIKCGKGTHFSYGPWADRQREHLFRFFFPNDYQPMQVTRPPQPGEKRRVQSFDIRLSTQNEATIDVLFSKNKETNAVHINIEPGSYLEITLPWIVQQDGYSTKINCQLLHVEASTSLQYRTLVESETLEFNIKSHYPLKWNDHQDWLISLTGCKATAHLIYSHKEFFQDLVNDWSSKAQPDLLHFVPYTWRFSLLLKEFELITLCNSYNWIDCSSQNQENAHIAFCGELFDLSFDLPFTEFLPQTVPIRIWIQGESVDMSLYVPETCTTRSILLSLDENAKIMDRDGNVKSVKRDNLKKWRKVCQRSNGWLDCWSVPIVALSITYTYHPQPPLGPSPQADITTPEKEELLLSPMRIPRCRKSQAMQWTRDKDGPHKFNPMTLPPDKVTVELEMGSSILLVYGSWIRSFINLKENIFGDDERFTDMEQERATVHQSSKHVEPGSREEQTKAKAPFDPRQYRLLDVVVSITMHDIQAHVMKNCGEKDPPCPMILLERFGLEMKKGYQETRLQILLSPAMLLMSDHVTRPNRDAHIGQGHLMLSGLQIRGHAMFSDEDRSLDQETVEYAWMIEVQLGKLSGKITTPQLHHLVTSLETLLLLVQDDENALRSPHPPSACIHEQDPYLCRNKEPTDPDKRIRCASSEEMKYRMTRVAVDVVDVYLVESGAAIHFWASPIRVCTCNLHGHRVKSGVSAVVPTLHVRQFICAGSSHLTHSNTNTNTTSSGRSQYYANRDRSDDMWLEVGSLSLGPLVVEAALALPTTQQDVHVLQHKFLKTHDDRHRRLWFLWCENLCEDVSTKLSGRCGCIGGCAFMGNNRNGRRFFKPTRQDIADGVNVAAFRMSDGGCADPGFGQSIIHEGQLVFHTPPYDSCQVTVEESYYYWDTRTRTRPKLPPQERVASGSPFPRRLEPAYSVVDTSSVTPSPVSDRRPVRRRFSCTSASNSKTGGGMKEVPYSRLMDTSISPNMNKDRSRSILRVPELQAQPRSSASDSKLAVDYFQQNIQYSGDESGGDWKSPSESHHSLSAAVDVDGSTLVQEVQRTVSMGSENQSEIFYSADEELTQSAAATVVVPEAVSSSRHSIIGALNRQDSCSVRTANNKYNSNSDSDSIMCSAGRDRGLPQSHCSDHELHTPPHKMLVVRGESSDLGLPSTSGFGSVPRSSHFSESQSNENMLMDSSDTHSISSTSFISAMSSQEDHGLVNLHMQINRPILEAPLLMSCYTNHLSQLGCSNWVQCSVPPGCDAYSIPGALFQKTSDGYLLYVGGNYLPHFSNVSEGFTYLKLLSRSLHESHATPPPPSSKTPTHPYSWDAHPFGDVKEDVDAHADGEMINSPCEAGSRTTIIIKLKGDIDVMVTPLVLESLQRFIDALTPTVASLHPLTVINHLHFGCISKVKDANILKKEEYLGGISQGAQILPETRGKDKVSGAMVQSNVYQESISTQTQVVIVLPKMNVTLLQASVVEELTPFSALDNIADFACVSIFAICLENITAKLHFERKAKETVQTFQRPAVAPSRKKSGILAKTTRPLQTAPAPGAPASPDVSCGDPVYIETSEKQQSEMIIILSFGKVHAQLRRLPNDSSVLQDSIVTAIPSQYSKVMFTCTKTCAPHGGDEHFMRAKEPGQDDKNMGEHSVSSEEKLGFIMFETGLEGVSIKVVKQEHFNKGNKDVTAAESRSHAPTTQPVPQPSTSTVLSQTEQLLTAMRFSSKTAASFNNFIEGKNLKHAKPARDTSSKVRDSKEEVKCSIPLATQTSMVEPTHEESNTSSCVVELATMWFNFAAPPRTPITRKIDYTRSDWNLLSTASPAISAWMNPSSRFASRLVHLFRSMYRRSSAVVSCLMAEALELREIHVPIKSRYGRLKALSKTLQEDPSCQLCSVLRKYLLQTDLAGVEVNLAESHLPMLTVLRQGVIVLSRQWKSVLYTPLLLDHNYKTRHLKPLNVTFALPESDDDVLTEGENSADEMEVTDECAALIDIEAGAVLNNIKAQEKAAAAAAAGSKAGGEEQSELSNLTSPSAQSTAKKKHLPPLNPPSSSRASIVFPILSSNHPFLADHSKHMTADNGTGYSVLKEDTLGRQLGSNGSTFSNGVHGSHHSLTSLDSNPTEDLYSWMAKQQEFIKEDELRTEMKNSWETAPSVPTEARDAVVSPVTGYSFYPVHDALCMLDAHLIFEPLLSSLGVTPQQMISNFGSSSGNSAVFDTWGSNLSLVGSMETLRIDIVVSEYGKLTKPSKPTKPTKPADKKKGKRGKNQDSKFYLELPSEMPAFICEKIGVEVDVKKLADITVDDMIQKQNVLYISRGQLKKHTSTRLNFSLNIHYISQQVNMPLLRLLHQISNMYQNVKDTQMELKEQNLKAGHAMSKDHKNGSSSTSDLQEHLPSDLQEHLPSDLQHLPLVTDHTLKTPMTGSRTSRTSVTHKTSLSPSASLLARPQLFAQKLRSTTKSVKGYMNLSDTVVTPLADAGGSAGSDIDKSLIPRCWKTVYFLLDLYATMPETKTISHRFSVPADVVDGYKGRRKLDVLEAKLTEADLEKSGVNTTPVPTDKPRELNLVTGERTRLVVFGVARIHRTRLLATLSGLKLEAEITNLHSSMTCKKKLRPESLECSLTGQVGRTMIVLLEGVAPNQQTVVKMTVGKSQALYSSQSRRTKDKNSGLLTVGAINIDIPQHPVALHGMVTRGSKQLSSTLQELGVTRVSRIARGMTIDETDTLGNVSPSHLQPGVSEPGLHATDSKDAADTSLLEPLVMQFSVVLQSLSITAALLPSLQAQYKMDQVNSSGVTGSNAKFTVELPRHSLSFTTKLQVTEANLPSEASIELPKVMVSAEYVQDGKNSAEMKLGDGVVLREGSYLNATADIGKFEHSLTTDLLNHLVFVQKVFMKEVNEVLQKVYGGEKVVPLWQEGGESTTSSLRSILFSLVMRIKRIQLTATTPTNSAVRLETGAVEFQLSNRVENISSSAQPNPYMKIFGKAQVDINLSLGQILKNVIFEEAEPEFQQFAFFKTRIGLRNAFQGEMVQGEGEDKEVVLITLNRPLVYIQPMAVDKAILVWLNYKNAYEYWNEQRSSLNKEVLTATQQVLEKVPFGQLTSSPHLGTLFLQLTVDDMGICLPLNPLPLTSWGLSRTYPDAESRGAVVVTLESTSISACSSGSLVSKGRFVGLCLRFADDFESSLDDWKPDMNDSTIMNLCVVSEGTYEVCSRTIAPKLKENAKWFLNVQWQMEGVDIHLDVNVGKQLSALGHTLTMLTGSTEEDETLTLDYDSDEVDGVQASQESISLRRSRNAIDSLPNFLLDPTIDSKRRSKMIEKEMLEQAKIINDLKCLGASHGTVEQEVKRLQELEAMVYKDFRRDMIQKLRRQSVKASSIKGKFGLGKNSSQFRSRSFIIPSPTPEHALEMESPDDLGRSSLRSAANSNSFESSPRSGPSRSASLRVREVSGPRVTFNEARNVCRQSSLPSADSDLSLPSESDWKGSDQMIIDGEKVQLRKKLANSSYEAMDTFDEASSCSSPTLTAPSPGLQKSQEPNIDFELDVKVFINSGKCVLHTKDSAKDEELRMASRMKKERSCSGGTGGMFEFPPASPNMSRRNKQADSKQGGSSTRLRYVHGHVAQLVDLTIFHIPGLDVKVHYESRIEAEENASMDLGFPGAVMRKPFTKKASLFAWTTLQSIPEETIISPHILEFLEQTLEPIPSSVVHAKDNFPSSGHTMFTMEGDAGWGAGNATTNYAYASFPVDVMVYFHMEPSTFRFSCLPVSRVECMLQLPSLDIVFSSKRAEEELHSEFGDCSRTSLGGYIELGAAASAVGGLSVTGCMSNFSVHIFHPYGGGKKSGIKEAQWSPLADSERKDSLSINVEFVKFHLSRSRKINFKSEQSTSSKGGKGSGLDQSRAAIRFSTIVDIGSASFKYDMRRLTEILAFPKAWYRRSIVRRLFLGELNVSAMYSEAGDSSPSSVDEEAALLQRPDGGWHVLDGIAVSRSNTSRSPMMAARDRLKLNLSSEHRSRFKEGGRMGTVQEDTSSPSDQRPSWETLVLFAVNFTKLSVQMNMGNVMGNVMWLTKDFHSEGRLSIGSTGHKNMYIGLGLGGCNLDAKGGIVGGTIELSQIDTFVHIREDPGTEPDHTVGLRLFALELRLDYMGTGVLMSRVSSLNVSLRDEWKIHSFNNTESFIPTRRPAMIFMHGDLGWDQLQVMISKSTTADLLKMFYKLDEFFSQQFQSSKRVFSSLQPRSHVRSSFRKKAAKKKQSSVDSSNMAQWSIQEAKHHRHWQKVLAVVGGLNLYTFKIPLPLNGTVLGGTMELHGSNISLACFHGINFKAKSWALFSLKEPCISFATEAQEVPSVSDPDKVDIHVVETLTFSLGMTSEQAHAQHHSMATICRMSRNILFPAQYKTLQEWFNYAFSTSEIDAVDRFPSLERDRTESFSSDEQKRNRGATKMQDPNHTREDIFALPSMQLHLKTEHLQSSGTPDLAGDKPVVECSFITEFEDHIFVTIDAEAFFFLHDLITSYVKEKERVVQGPARAHSPEPDKKKDSATVEDEKKRKAEAFDPSEMFTKDWRTYHCKTWHLEPTVRLWSWAGKSLEPYGIDYILQKLGFSHARTTIPKWMQRGFMDPLDKVLAVLMMHMVTMVKEGSNEVNKTNSTLDTQL